jgi:hypothetical protein
LLLNAKGSTAFCPKIAANGIPIKTDPHTQSAVTVHGPVESEHEKSSKSKTNPLLSSFGMKQR